MLDLPRSSCTYAAHTQIAIPALILTACVASAAKAGCAVWTEPCSWHAGLACCRLWRQLTLMLPAALHAHMTQEEPQCGSAPSLTQVAPPTRLTRICC